MIQKLAALNMRVVSIALSVTMCVLLPIAAQAQWTPSGNDIYNTNSGNVGIGFTGPWLKLTVNGSIGAVGSVQTSGTDGAFYAWDRNGSGWAAAFYRLNGVSRLWDSTAGDVLTFDTNGKVGIGGYTPAARLYVAGGSFGSPVNANQSMYALGAQSIASDSSIYSYSSICAQNQLGNCAGTGGVVLGIPNTSAATNIPNTGNVFFNNGSKRYERKRKDLDLCPHRCRLNALCHGHESGKPRDNLYLQQPWPADPGDLSQRGQRRHSANH